MLIPPSVWEQDEACFAAAAVEIDVADSRPHAPFFPLWIGLGKVLVLMGVPPAAALQSVSGVAGSLTVLPLVGLWSRRLGVGLSAAVAALAVFVPGVWVLSTRAFTGTTATAMSVLALFLWSRPQPTRWTPATGSAAAGLSVLVRPQFGLVVAADLVAGAILVFGPSTLAHSRYAAPLVVVSGGSARTGFSRSGWSTAPPFHADAHRSAAIGRR